MEIAATMPGLDFEPPPMLQELVARDVPAPDFVDALQRYVQVPRAARHPLLDIVADHAETLRTIAIALAAGPAGRRGLAVGVLGALDARASFYEQMQLFLAAVDRVTEERS